tara:strand:- start:51 stop:773 length:723 start_codon:yes stop_codon:yes gene_type:complete
MFSCGNKISEQDTDISGEKKLREKLVKKLFRREFISKIEMKGYQLNQDKLQNFIDCTLQYLQNNGINSVDIFEDQPDSVIIRLSIESTENCYSELSINSPLSSIILAEIETQSYWSIGSSHAKTFGSDALTQWIGRYELLDNGKVNHYTRYTGQDKDYVAKRNIPFRQETFQDAKPEDKWWIEDGILYIYSNDFTTKWFDLNSDMKHGESENENGRSKVKVVSLNMTTEKLREVLNVSTE